MENLEKLSKNELLLLQKEINMLLDHKVTSETILLYDAIKSVLWNRYRITIPTSYKSNSLTKLLKDTVIFLDEVTITYKLSPDRRDMSNLYYLFAETVSGYLHRLNIPCTPKNILVNYDKFLGELDNNFPGYLKAGILNIIIGGFNEPV
jgi:hypothetical protein